MDNIEYHLSQIEKRIEELVKSSNQRLEQHIDSTTIALKQTNTKLDEISEVVKQVAVLQEKQSHHTLHLERLDNGVMALRTELLHEIHKLDEKTMTMDRDKKDSIVRIHTRMEDFDADIRAKADKNDEKHHVITETIAHLEKEVGNKISFVRGIMAVLGIVLMIAQGLAVKMYNDIDHTMKEGASTDLQINNKLHEMDRQFDSIINSINNLGTRK